MQIAVYVIYELLIRLQDLNPGIGEYISNKKKDENILVRTSTGHLTIPERILQRQFHEPTAISQQEILDVLDNFKGSNSE